MSVTKIKNFNQFVNENLNSGFSKKGRVFKNTNKLNEGIDVGEFKTPDGLVTIYPEYHVFEGNWATKFPSAAKKGRFLFEVSGKMNFKDILSGVVEENHSFERGIWQYSYAISTKWTIPYKNISGMKVTKSDAEKIKQEIVSLYDKIVPNLYWVEDMGEYVSKGNSFVNYLWAGYFKKEGGKFITKENNKNSATFSKLNNYLKPNQKNASLIKELVSGLNSIVSKSEIFSWEKTKGTSTNSDGIPGLILNNVRVINKGEKDSDYARGDSRVYSTGELTLVEVLFGVLDPLVYALGKVEFVIKYLSDPQIAQYLYDDGISKLQPTDFAKGEEITPSEFVNLNKQNLAVVVKPKVPDNVAPEKIQSDNQSLRYDNRYSSLNEAKSCKSKVVKFLEGKECTVDYTAGTCKVGTKTMKIEKALLKFEAPESLIKSYTEECTKEVNEALRLMRRR